jgi:ElaA protein
MIQWTLATLRELGPEEVYQVVVLRQRVFIVEQTCAYLDCDGHDVSALHLLGRTDAGLLQAYARLLGPGMKYCEPSIGRVVVEPAARGVGVGRALVREAISRARDAFGAPLRIGAQMHLERFYGSFGFVRSGNPYDENGIPHVCMILT